VRRERLGQPSLPKTPGIGNCTHRNHTLQGMVLEKFQALDLRVTP